MEICPPEPNADGMTPFRDAQASGPFDPVPLLILADWLEERGDLAGAEAMRGLAASGIASIVALALAEAANPSEEGWWDTGPAAFGDGREEGLAGYYDQFPPDAPVDSIVSLADRGEFGRSARRGGGNGDGTGEEGWGADPRDDSSEGLASVEDSDWLPTMPVEYPLPSEIPARDPLADAYPWFARLARKDEEGARAQLAGSWEGIEYAGPSALRDRLLWSYRPSSVDVYGHLAFLRLEGPGARSLYLGMPSPPRGEGPAPNAFGPANSDAVMEFSRHFAGLRDAPPGHSGGFLGPEEWSPFEEYGWAIARKDRDWARAPAIYNAPNGDLLLVGPAGVAWAVLSMPRTIRPVCDTFDEFLIRYAGYLAHSIGMDSFDGPRDPGDDDDGPAILRFPITR